MGLTSTAAPSPLASAAASGPREAALCATSLLIDVCRFFGSSGVGSSGWEIKRKGGQELLTLRDEVQLQAIGHCLPRPAAVSMLHSESSNKQVLRHQVRFLHHLAWAS